jgi:hypothetical protein
MSIFGTSYCKLSGSIELELQYSTLTSNYIDNAEIDFISVLSGKKTFTNNRMHYSSFDIDINLFKYGSSKADVFRSLSKLKNEEFYFYSHIDDTPIHDIYDENILFHMVEMKPYYLTQQAEYDAVRLRIISTTYTYLDTGVYTGGYGTNYGLRPYGFYGW